MGRSAHRRITYPLHRLEDDDGTVHQRVEHFLSRVESYAAEALRRFVAAPESLSAPDRATLSFFFALLEGRTIGGLERIGSLVEMTLLAAHADRTSDPELFAQDYLAAIGPDDPATIERQRHLLLEALAGGRVQLSNRKEIAVELLLDQASLSAQLLYQLEWELLVAPDGGFLTSDRSLAMFDPSPPYPWSGNGLLSSVNAQTTFPLDSHHLLWVTPGDTPATAPGTPSVVVDPGDVMELNLRTYGWADTYIFAETQKTATEVRRQAKQRPAHVPRPRPALQAALIETESGDTRLADEHRRRGWPPHVRVGGKAHDYVVLDPDDNPIEKSIDLTALGRERAVRRLGTENLRAHSVAIHPTELAKEIAGLDHNQVAILARNRAVADLIVPELRALGVAVTDWRPSRLVPMSRRLCQIFLTVACTDDHKTISNYAADWVSKLSFKPVIDERHPGKLLAAYQGAPVADALAGLRRDLATGDPSTATAINGLRAVFGSLSQADPADQDQWPDADDPSELDRWFSRHERTAYDDAPRMLDELDALVWNNPGLSIGALRKYLREIPRPTMDDGGVKVGTIQATKGLEWPIVYLLGLEQGCLPDARALPDEDDIPTDADISDLGSLEEERRICFVAVTRAAHRLVVSHVSHHHRQGIERPCDPSEFLDQIREPWASSGTRHAASYRLMASQAAPEKWAAA
jgi:Protein of unknown function (DUF4238)/UvrD-like helicase C-terminal domain